MRRAIFILASVCLTSGIACGQWVPISGRIVTTTETISSDGTVSMKWKTVSQYSRSSSGSVLIQRLGRSGKPATGTLIDYGKSKRVYSLTYNDGKVNDTHHALDRGYAAAPPTGPTVTHQKSSLGTEKVNGIDCFIVPVYDISPTRERSLIGKAWLAPGFNNLVVKEDVMRPKLGGSKRHIVREFTVTSQNEPDPSLFSTDRAAVTKQWKVPAVK